MVSKRGLDLNLGLSTLVLANGLSLALARAEDFFISPNDITQAVQTQLSGTPSCEDTSSSANRDLFCKDPYAWVCKTKIDEFNAFNEKVDTKVSGITERLLNDEKSPFHNNKEFDEQAYRRAIYSEFEKDLGTPQALFEEMKAIYGSGPTSDLKLVSASSLMQTSAAQSVLYFCGPFLEGPGAFTLPDRKTITLCPGALFMAKNADGSWDEARLAAIFAHELGHWVPFDESAQTQSLACLSKHYLKDFNAKTGRAQPVMMMQVLFEGEKKKTKSKKTGSLAPYADEIFADYHSIDAYYARESKRLKDRPLAERLQSLQKAFLPLCSFPKSDVHPAGDFRLNQLLGRDPKIREWVSCKTPMDQRPTCHP